MQPSKPPVKRASTTTTTSPKLNTQEIKVQLDRAQTLMNQNRTIEARILLRHIKHPAADRMLNKLNVRMDRDKPKRSLGLSVLIGIGLCFLVMAVAYFILAVAPISP